MIKRLPPPDLSVILCLCSFPLIMYLLVELIKGSVLPAATGLTILVAIAAIGTFSFAGTALWWMLANPALPGWKPQLARRKRNNVT